MKIIHLGSGTTFNVVDICTANGIDYRILNVGNFYIKSATSDSRTLGKRM